MYYVMYASVRMAQAATFDAARAELVRLMRERMLDSSALRNSERYRRQLTEAEALTMDPRGSCAVVSEWDWISDGAAGVAAGDMATVHEYSNGCRDQWTVDVKCKILAVLPPGQVRVRITGESSQFDRGADLVMPASFIRTRRGT